MIKTELNTEQLQKDLQNLSVELQEKAVRAGVAKVAGEGVKLMRQFAPVDTGNLQKSIRRKQLSKTAKSRMGYDLGDVVQLVGPNMKIAGRYHGRIANVLEGGAKPHDIMPRKESRVRGFLKAQGLAGDKSQVLANDKRVFGRKVHHPGIKAYWFMRRADQANQGRAEGLFYQGISDYLRRKKLIE